MARSDPPFNLRLPADLRGRLEDSAAHSGRSLTAEILTRLEQSYAGSDSGAVVTALVKLGERISELERKLVAQKKPTEDG